MATQAPSNGQLRFTVSQVLQLLTILLVLVSAWVDITRRVESLRTEMTFRMAETDRRIDRLEAPNTRR